MNFQTNQQPGAQPAFRPVVLAPTFNNQRTLVDVLDRVARLKLPVIVVDDGSTDGTARLLADWTQTEPGRDATVLRHPVNRGKAAALRTGFEHARAAGFTHAATIDTDGQLDPEAIPALLDLARRDRFALVIGRRDEKVKGQPARSRVGRRLSNLAIRCECGVVVADSQCGQRVYPLGLFGPVRCGAGRFAFEAEVITRAAWAGCPIIEAPVPCIYQPEGERVSHFKPWLDTFHGLGLHAYLLGRALLPWPHPRWQEPLKKQVSTDPLWRRVLNWFSPFAAWAELRTQRAGRVHVSLSFGVGVFIACFPWGLHTLVALFLAARLHLNAVATVAGTLLATPPPGAILALGSISVGHFVLRGRWPRFAEYNPATHGFWNVFREAGLEWVVGGSILGVALGALGFTALMFVLRTVPLRLDPDQPLE